MQAVSRKRVVTARHVVRQINLDRMCGGHPEVDISIDMIVTDMMDSHSVYRISLVPNTDIAQVIKFPTSTRERAIKKNLPLTDLPEKVQYNLDVLQVVHPSDSRYFEGVGCRYDDVFYIVGEDI